ncbi:MAG: hypothetical protein NTW21_34580 [Verrucomicrobia bacterium]|nr:hypothetical protein [Verrucomicrobiota bacterium]
MKTIHQLRDTITHSTRDLAVAALVVAVAGLSAVPAQANTLTFPRSQTLDGWHERAYVGGVWTDLAPDVKSLVSTDGNGDLRGFTGGAGTATVWLRSPEFTLELAGDLTIAQAYIASSRTMPASDALVPATKASDGFAGIALRDVSTGNFVLTRSAATVWAQVKFTAAELAPYVGQVLTVDLISQSAVGDSLSVNRPITVPGTLGSVPSDPYGLWSNRTFANGALTDQDPAHDPDGDGLTNQQEFAFGLDPTTGASSNPISEQLDPATGTFKYTRLASSDLDHTVEFSADLSIWDPATYPESIGDPDSNGVRIVAVTVTDSPSTARSSCG